MLTYLSKGIMGTGRVLLAKTPGGEQGEEAQAVRMGAEAPGGF